MKLNVIMVFGIVTVAALVGMAMGGTFGYFAGKASPELFARFVMWARLDPIPTAIVMGMAAGTMLGGALGVFGVIIQTVYDAISARKSDSGKKSEN
jgi:hypothetical protein